LKFLANPGSVRELMSLAPSPVAVPVHRVGLSVNVKLFNFLEKMNRYPGLNKQSLA
jgi:hypothetical protein